MITDSSSSLSLNELGAVVTVRALKYDGSLHRKWSASVLNSSTSSLVLRGEFKERIDHPLLGLIQTGTISTEYFWRDRWFNIFRFDRPDGSFQTFYCNVAMPPTVEAGLVSFVDLDIDLLVDGKFEIRVLDQDEFEKNVDYYNYAPELQRQVEEAKSELIQMITGRQFPFEEKLSRREPTEDRNGI